ncbi:unnamed protein product [Cuscuta campestris]|uniref:MnmE helical domain-containing protein n=1 Tax=Cuscuta campestris TaxID=132261 RepID=A0A484LR10_9ASTE|nr:unnamed protein product [Cuscuta campestris]
MARGRGEFTLRAFLNGRLDLSQAENVGKLVSAKSTASADSALAGMQGGFSSLVKSIRMQCIELLTEIEARLDFDDEVPPLNLNVMMEKIYGMVRDIDSALETANYDKLLQSGIQVYLRLILKLAISLPTHSRGKHLYLLSVNLGMFW